MGGLITLLSQNPLLFLVTVVSLVTAITIHEFAHAFVADKLGDPTPRVHDRVTLNPASHLDPIGTLAILLVGFGWGKPVPYDPYNLENPKRDSLYIALAGPASNFILAGVLAIMLRLLPAEYVFIKEILYLVIQLNVILGVFNLVPIPPLDGSKILSSLLPLRQSIEWEEISNRYGIYLLLLFVLFFSNLIYPVVDFITRLLLI